MTKWRVTYRMADARQTTKNKTSALIKRSISEILNDYFKSFLSKPVNIRTWTLMTENTCKSLHFNTMPVITTRFGRKRGTLECGVHDVACVANVIGEGEGRAPNSLIFSCFPRSPSLSPDVFCESLFFQIKMASAREAFSISKAKTLKLYAMSRCKQT